MTDNNEQVYSSQADLKDIPLRSVEMDLFVDGNRFVDCGKRKAGYYQLAPLLKRQN